MEVRQPTTRRNIPHLRYSAGRTKGVPTLRKNYGPKRTGIPSRKSSEPDTVGGRHNDPGAYPIGGNPNAELHRGRTATSAQTDSKPEHNKRAEVSIFTQTTPEPLRPPKLTIRLIQQQNTGNPPTQQPHTSICQAHGKTHQRNVDHTTLQLPPPGGITQTRTSGNTTRREHSGAHITPARSDRHSQQRALTIARYPNRSKDDGRSKDPRLRSN